MRSLVKHLLACCLTLGLFATPGLAHADDGAPIAKPAAKPKSAVKKTAPKKAAKPKDADLLLPQPDPLDAGLAATPARKGTAQADVPSKNGQEIGASVATTVIPLPPPRPALLAKFDQSGDTTEDELQTASIPLSGPLGVRVNAETLTRPAPDEPAGSDSVDTLISKHAQRYGLPESLLRRVVKRESGGNPGLRHGPYLGLMQMRLDTARGMGYNGGAQGLLDANTSLTYGAAYLANAWRVSGGNPDRAVSLYAAGYYYEAKRKGMLPKLIKATPVK